jgi:UDP-N-acetylmuramyl pentapeptide phosphotransferase/UDP-N-acetylglucosamine-1-phosphate transferase
MSVVGLALAGGVAVVAASLVLLLVATSQAGRDDAIRHALVIHGVAWLVFVVLALLEDPLDLPALAKIPVGVMALAWGVAWVLIGRSYGLGTEITPARDGRRTRRFAPGARRARRRAASRSP